MLKHRNTFPRRFNWWHISYKLLVISIISSCNHISDDRRTVLMMLRSISSFLGSFLSLAFKTFQNKRVVFVSLSASVVWGLLVAMILMLLFFFGFFLVWMQFLPALWGIGFISTRLHNNVFLWCIEISQRPVKLIFALSIRQFLFRTLIRQSLIIDKPG